MLSLRTFKGLNNVLRLGHHHKSPLQWPQGADSSAHMGIRQLVIKSFIKMPQNNYFLSEVVGIRPLAR